MIRIGVITTSRADYGIYRPVLAALRDDEAFDVQLFVGGTHLEDDYGATVSEVEADGFPIAARIPCTPNDDGPLPVVDAMAAATRGFGAAFAKHEIDLVMALGDRSEMFAAVAATVPMRIPVAHLHGGESTEGAIDDVFRHAITKMSHLHFASTQIYADRIMQMGEEEWRVVVSGAPGLDNLANAATLSREELQDRFEIAIESAPLLVTFHPVTMETESTANHVDELLDALGYFDVPIVFTYPNQDNMGRYIRQRIDGFVSKHANATMVSSMGTAGYFGLMRDARAMVGNSSSGIIEAASFGLPVVDIGTRQDGRLRPANVIHCGPTRQAIVDAIKHATSKDFVRSIEGMENPYGDGTAAAKIVDALRVLAMDERLPRKRFVDRGK